MSEGAGGGYRDFYESIPFGLVSRIVPKEKSKLPSVHKFENWLEASDHAWKAVHSALPSLPSIEKYDEETWEWTVGKDYWDHRRDTAAYKVSYGSDLFMHTYDNFFFISERLLISFIVLFFVFICSLTW